MTTILFTPKNNKELILMYSAFNTLVLKPGFNNVPDDEWKTVLTISSDLLNPMIEDKIIVQNPTETKKMNQSELKKALGSKTKTVE